MPILQLIFVLVVVGVALYLINRYVPMQPTIKKILNIAVIIIVVLWLAAMFGLLPSMANLRVGR